MEQTQILVKKYPTWMFWKSNEYNTEEIESRLYIHDEDIKMIAECFDSSLNLKEDFCKISINNIGDVVVNHSYDEIKNNIKKTQIKGFYNGN